MATRQETTRQRRNLIVDTAAECFIKKGFHQTSVRDIAHMAGISVGNLYNHFAGKDALIAEFASQEAQSIDGLRRSLAKISGTAERMDRFVIACLHSASDPSTAALTMELTAESIRNPEIARLFSPNRAALLEVLSEILSCGRAEGKFSNAVPLAEQAETILDMIEGLALRSAFSDAGLAKQAEDALSVMVRKIIAR